MSQKRSSSSPQGKNAAFRSAIKKGGGFLSNVDGTLKDYEFTARFKGEKKDGEWLYFVPSILVDGADEPVDQHMFIGAAENYEIGDDGKSLTMADGSSVSFGFSTPFGRFMDSLLEKGFPENELPNLEDGEPLTLEALIDRRFRFKQEVDEKANEKFGKSVRGSGTNKEQYDRTNTVIDAVLEMPQATTVGPATGSPIDLSLIKWGEPDAPLHPFMEKVCALLECAEPLNEASCIFCKLPGGEHAEMCAVPLLEFWLELCITDSERDARNHSLRVMPVCCDSK